MCGTAKMPLNYCCLGSQLASETYSSQQRYPNKKVTQKKNQKKKTPNPGLDFYSMLNPLISTSVLQHHLQRSSRSCSCSGPGWRSTQATILAISDGRKELKCSEIQCEETPWTPAHQAAKHKSLLQPCHQGLQHGQEQEHLATTPSPGFHHRSQNKMPLSCQVKEQLETPAISRNWTQF